jgi:hypothetical protein
VDELSFNEGSRAAWIRMLRLCLRELDPEPGETSTLARFTLHLAETRAALRRLCETHGDNSWDDSLWLPDVIDKHLHLESSSADSELLQELHGYVAELCQKLGAKPDEVPCDVWHLALLIDQLRSERDLLAQGWNRVGRAALAGWDDAFLKKLDAARDRALYPNKKP